MTRFALLFRQFEIIIPRSCQGSVTARALLVLFGNDRFLNSIVEFPFPITVLTFPAVQISMETARKVLVGAHVVAPNKKPRPDLTGAGFWT